MHQVGVLQHLVIESLAVAAPLILYARDVIAQLEEPRAELEEMSRRLATTAEDRPSRPTAPNPPSSPI